MGIVKRGFSLLEVVLAVAVLGVSLPILLNSMANNLNETVKQVQNVMLQNTAQNIQNILDVSHVELPLDGESRAFCGYKNDRFTMATNATGFDGSIFMIHRESVESIINGSAKRIQYRIYPWNLSTNNPQLNNEYKIVNHFMALSSLGSNEWKFDAILGDIVAMQEGIAKFNASWTYAYITSTTYKNSSKEYGASQIFEYTSEINKNYINSIMGNDTVAQAYAQSLYDNITRNANNRMANYESLKQDPVLGAIMTQTMNAQFAITDALKANPTKSIAEAQSAVQSAINATWDFVNSSEQNKADYTNTVGAYTAVYNYFIQNPSKPMGDGPAIFNANLNGTISNSYGSMAASILMSLGSTQNVLNAYLSGK